MWIRMISTAAGPRLPHSLQSGTTYQVSDELGSELVEIRAAEEVSDPRPKKADAPAEVAAIDEGEKALDPAGDTKSKSLIDQLTGKKPDGAADQGDDAADQASEKKPAKAAAKKS